MGIIFAVLLISAAGIATAAAVGGEPVLEDYSVNMYIAYSKVLVETSMSFAARQSANISIGLPFDARAISARVDGKLIDPVLDGNILSLSLKDARNATFAYITNEPLEGDTFIAAAYPPLDAGAVHIRLSLPEGAVIETRSGKASLQGSGVHPKPTGLDTDGRVITVIWDFEDVPAGEETSLYLKYKKPFTYLLPAILAFIGVLAIIISATYLLSRRRHKEKKVSDKKDSAKPAVNEVYGIEDHLKEDEAQIIRILKLKEGSCEQGTLRVATDFSKAKLSGLLKELEDRKVIYKEKRGKKNLVFLK
jgi:hypothetical protein